MEHDMGADSPSRLVGPDETDEMLWSDEMNDCLDMDEYEMTRVQGEMFIERYNPDSPQCVEVGGVRFWPAEPRIPWHREHPVVRVTRVGDDRYLVCGGTSVEEGGEGWKDTGPHLTFTNLWYAGWWAKEFLDSGGAASSMAPGTVPEEGR